MPWVNINIMEGHSQEEKTLLHENVTKAIADSLNLPKEYIKIQLLEMTDDNHSTGGKRISELSDAN